VISIDYNVSSDYQTTQHNSISIGYATPTWGIYMKSHPYDSYDAIHDEAFLFGVSYHIIDRLRMNIGGGKAVNYQNFKNPHWDKKKKVVYEVGMGCRLIDKLIVVEVQANVYVGFEIMLYSGVGVGIKIH
jgi:hypothetical protein